MNTQPPQAVPTDVPELSNLRPRKLTDYIGQHKAVETLRVFIDAVLQRGYSHEHILLYGPPGIGKTTLAHIIAHELGGDIKTTSGAALQKSGDIAAILTNLADNDILFIDEIHRIPKTVEELLYPVIEDMSLDIIIGKGPSARTVRLPVPKITIVGATTKLANLSAPLRDRFGLLMRLDYYTPADMQHIILRSAKLLNLDLSPQQAATIADRSRRTPRLANRVLRRLRDYVEVHKITRITDDVFEKVFSMLGIDQAGLTDIDRKYLHTLGIKFGNTPTGIETLASSLSEDIRTVEEFIEPYLLQIGFLKKTTKGRELTPKALNTVRSENTKHSKQDQPPLI